MTDTDAPYDLSGKLLIAMPGMGDPRFANAVVFLCAYSGDGAMGIVINKPVPDLTLDDLLEQLDIDRGKGSAGVGVFFGGPVEGGRGFVLHSSEYDSNPSSLLVNETFAMTATKDILVDIAQGNGPAAVLAALGYAGWGPGQLEGELQQNAWLMVDADAAIVFDRDHRGKWAKALRKLRIDPSMLSSGGGRA